MKQAILLLANPGLLLPTFAHRLPPHWKIVGRALPADVGRDNLEQPGNLSLVVDSTGRYMYGAFGMGGNRWDFRTAAKRRFVIAGEIADPDVKPAVDSYLATWSSSVPDGRIDLGESAILAARGDELAGRAISVPARSIAHPMFVVRIGGRATKSDGRSELHALLALGCDFVTLGGAALTLWAGGVPSDPRLQFAPGVAKILHGRSIRSVKVPDVPAWWVSGCVRWSESRVYELTTTAPFRLGYQVSYAAGHQSSRRIPWVQSSVVGILADETVCTDRSGAEPGQGPGRHVHLRHEEVEMELLSWAFCFGAVLRRQICRLLLVWREDDAFGKSFAELIRQRPDAPIRCRLTDLQ